MVKSKPKKRPFRIKSIVSLRKAHSIPAKILAAVIYCRGKVTKIARAFHVTTQRIYTIIACYCNIESFTCKKRTRYKSFINEKTKPSKQRLETRKRAKYLRHIPLIKKFSHSPAIPSSSYVRKFCTDNNIRFCKASTSTPEKMQALCASNIILWFKKINTQDIIDGVRERAIINMDEIAVFADGNAKVAKRRGKKRAVVVENDIDPGHITLALSIARGIKQAPQFFIIGDLTYVPLRVQEMAEAEAFFVFVSKRDFMTKVLFREWCTILINWVLEQKLIGYYAQDEKIILFVDGDPSMRD
ncbi:MAG: hypothetical protein EZS28_003853 [Streblomastix strix]|uniref:DDE-1 domain-containing protein n=1 Tax=Streblomastix strix TaxID=222440 RepID=A0A5J4X1H5_9EUKA|nr:MAG: hypothetical protein EZS28_003853 [Streblomastix strix]